MTSWKEISIFLKEDESGYLIQALKNLVGEAKNLPLIEVDDDLEIVANRGFLTKRTKRLLQKYFDDWTVMSQRVQLGDIEIYKKLFEKPSILLEMHDDVDRPEELWAVLPLTRRHIENKVSTILDPCKWIKLYAVEELDEEASATDLDSIMRKNAKELFCDLLANRCVIYCASKETLMDEKYDPFVEPGRTTTAKRLLSNAETNTKAFVMRCGIIETLQTTIDCLPRFKHVQFIDLSGNRIGDSEWDNICKILDIISKNKGALAIWDNPAVCSTSKLQELALLNLESFLRLIWISKQKIHNASHTICVTMNNKISTDDCKQIRYAHVAFFEHFTRLGIFRN